MDAVPNHRALFGVDVVGSASNPGYHLESIPRAVNSMLDEALRRSGIDPAADVIERQHTGDGTLLTLPSERLGALLEAANELDFLARDRNRRHRPDIRLRLAVEVGPVGDEPGFYQPRIVLARLLDASAFKELFDRCLAEGGESVNTGLVVSGTVRENVFGGDYTRLVRLDDFVALPVEHKEFRTTAWARIPGFDSRSLAALIGGQPVRPPSPERSDQPGGHVTNYAAGNVGVQAEKVNGPISFRMGGR